MPKKCDVAAEVVVAMAEFGGYKVENGMCINIYLYICVFSGESFVL